jgi:hypothetical protein
VLVVYRDGILLQIPAAAIEPQNVRHAPPTKVTAATIVELLSTAQEFGGLPPSTRYGFGDPFPAS